MDIEQQANYYAVIPAPVRYNKKLKYPERLLYGEITALSNRYGYCFASNKYIYKNNNDSGIWQVQNERKRIQEHFKWNNKLLWVLFKKFIERII